MTPVTPKTARERWLPLLVGLSEARMRSKTHYSPKGSMRIRTHHGQFSLADTDQFDPSDSFFLRVAREGFVIRIPWDIITGISGVEPEEAASDRISLSSDPS